MTDLDRELRELLDRGQEVSRAHRPGRDVKIVLVNLDNLGVFSKKLLRKKKAE